MPSPACANPSFSSVSASHFLFFDAPPEASPSYLLFPNVREFDIKISLRLKRNWQDKQEKARQALVNQAALTPFGKRQISYSHHINRFRQARLSLKDTRQEAIRQARTVPIKAIMQEINGLMRKPVKCLEDKERLEELKGLLSPSYKAKAEIAKQQKEEEFNAIFQEIKATFADTA